MSQPYIWATYSGPRDEQKTIRERIDSSYQNLAKHVQVKRARGDFDDRRQARYFAREKRPRARCADVHRLHAGSFLQYRGLFLPGLARLSDYRCCAHGNHRMGTATSAYSIGFAGVDLSKLDSITYIRAVAHIFWLVRTVNYGT